MKLGLICSGLSHLPRSGEEGENQGCRLPRVLLARDSQQFLPDFALLLLVDQILMDRRTFEGLLRGQVLSGPTVPLLARLLHQEGFLRLEDFEGVGRAQESHLAALLQADVAALESWVPTVRAWFSAWQSHYQGIQGTLRPVIKQMRDDAAAGEPAELDYSQAAAKFIHDTGGRYQMANFYAEEALAPEGESLEGDRRAEFQTLLSEELRLARGNLFLCEEFGAAQHDWCDLEPFYKSIVARGGEPAGAGKSERTTTRIFELPLPEFSFWHPDHVIRALKDPQVGQLRERVRESLAARKPLVHSAAQATLSAIRRFDQSVTTIRMVTATLSAAPKRREKPVESADRGAGILREDVLLLTSRALAAKAAKKTGS